MKHFVFVKNWSKNSASFILDEIKKVISENSKCNIIVTGGSSAKRVYLSLGKFKNFQKMKNIFFYLSDERCVSLTSKFCNYKMIKKSLLKNNKNKFYKINSNILLNGNYEKLLKKKINILLISVGSDGHIASIFDNSSMLKKNNNALARVKCKKKPSWRITITPKIISLVEKIIVLAPGKKKFLIFKQIKEKKKNFHLLPAALLRKGTWLLDQNL